MENRKFVPSWFNKGKNFMKKNIIEESEEDRLKRHRDEIAQILIDNCTSAYDREYYDEMMHELEDDMAVIGEFIEKDNLRKRDIYLNGEIDRCNVKIEDKIDYESMISSLEEKIKNNNDKVSKFFDEIRDLTDKLEEIKKNKPYVQRNKKVELTPEEQEIKARLENIPHEKNKIEEENNRFENSIESYKRSMEYQESVIKGAQEYKQYIMDNWDRYYHNGVTIVLPS